MNEPASLLATVSGRVQGVFYRDYTGRCARELGLTGYARNLRGGNVEVRAEGERRQLEKLVDCLKTGSPASRVDNVTTTWSAYTGGYPGFSTG